MKEKRRTAWKKRENEVSSSLSYMHESAVCSKAEISSLQIGLLNNCYGAMRKQNESATQLNNNYFAVFFHITLLVTLPKQYTDFMQGSPSSLPYNI